MATNKSRPLLQVRHNLSGLLLTDWNWLHPIVIALTHCAQWNFTSNGMGHFSKLIVPHTWTNSFFHALEVNLLKTLPQLAALQIFQSSYLSHAESLNHNIFYHIIIRLILNIFYTMILFVVNCIMPIKQAVMWFSQFHLPGLSLSW